MANFLKQSIQYRIRKTGDTSTMFYLTSKPNYLPEVGQTVVVSHTDVQSGSVLESAISTAQTNIFTAAFVTSGTLTASVDGYTYYMELIYTDTTLTSASGKCYGGIEYDVEPATYETMKDVSATAIVQELLPYNGTDGKNELYCYREGNGTTSNIAPMIIVNRNATNNVFSNLFKSFNLPTTTEEIAEFRQTSLGTLTKDSTGTILIDGVKYKWSITGTATDTVIDPINGYTGKYYGTAYQGLCPTDGGVDYDNILVVEIPNSKYGEIIDGKTVRLRIPKFDGGGTYDIYSAYQENTDLYETTGLDTFLSEHNLMASAFGSPMNATTTTDVVESFGSYESNVALLFCDTIKRPGGDPTKSWSTGYDAVINGEKVYYYGATTQKEMFNLINDQCVGIAYLDKGFVVITDPTIVKQTITNYVTNAYYGNSEFGDAYNTAAYRGTDPTAKVITNYTTGTTIDKTQSQFLFSSGGTSSTCQYVSYNTEKSLNIVCLASTGEFYRTTNPTAKELLGVPQTADYADFKPDATSNSYLYPVIITEIGLHDSNGNLLAICKPTVPIRKYWYDVVSFNIRIRL